MGTFNAYNYYLTSFLHYSTGLVMSKGSGIMSRGHTTMWNPPPKYVAKVLDSKKFAQYDITLPKGCTSIAWDELPKFLQHDGVEIHKVPSIVVLVLHAVVVF